jgi:hypothetical protein
MPRQVPEAVGESRQGPVDVTEAMIYLCGQSGRYVTGITLPVDAGYTV